MLLKMQFYAKGVAKLCSIMLMVFSVIMLNYAHNNLNYAHNHENYAEVFQLNAFISKSTWNKLCNYF